MVSVSRASCDCSGPTICVTVLGAVQKPGVVDLPEHTTILSALAAAGGWAMTAKTEKVILLRGGPGKKLEHTEYDIRAILAGDAPAVALRDGDVIFVNPRLW